MRPSRALFPGPRIAGTLAVSMALLAGCTAGPPKTAGPTTTSTDGRNRPAPGGYVQRQRLERHPSVVWPQTANLSAPEYDWPSPSEDLWATIRTGFELPGNRWRDRVRRWTQWYATHPDHLISALKRARPWLYHIVELITKRDMPTEIALLPIVESAYKTAVVSSAGASGLWQFMPATARYMGLTLNGWYDGRNDPFKATPAALSYLQKLNERYNGNWLLALAAYNAGPGRVDDALAEAERSGKPTTFWRLDLPRETINYVPKLLAVRWIMSAPSKFGIDWPKLSYEPKTRLVDLPAQMSLSIAAELADVPASRLAALNPDMKRQRTRPRHGALVLPANSVATFREKLAAVDLSELMDDSGGTYRIRPGDTLNGIARRFGVSVAALRRSNDIAGNRIIAGQVLRIPNGAGERGQSGFTSYYTVAAGDTLWQIAQTYNTSVGALRRANAGLGTTLQPGERIAVPGSSGPAPAATPTEVVVAPSDTLWSIARQNNVSVATLRRANGLSADDAIYPGQTLTIAANDSTPTFYRVERGDTLWSIAQRFSLRIKTLKRLNDLSESQAIYPGQRLQVAPAVSS